MHKKLTIQLDCQKKLITVIVELFSLIEKRRLKTEPHQLQLTLLEDTSRLHSPFKCSGSHEIQVIHCLWPFSVFPICFPVDPFQTTTSPLLQPEATRRPLGDQARASTQSEWAAQVCLGVSVNKSQRRTVVSPDPEARHEPVGEKATWRTGWP